MPFTCPACSSPPEYWSRHCKAFEIVNSDVTTSTLVTFAKCTLVDMIQQEHHGRIGEPRSTRACFDGCSRHPRARCGCVTSVGVRADFHSISVVNTENGHRTSTRYTRRYPRGFPANQPSTAPAVLASETRSVVALLLRPMRIDARKNNFSTVAITCRFIAGIQKPDRYGGVRFRR